MTDVKRPTKDQVRQHMRGRVDQQRSKEHAPPPSPEDIRRELGWHMIPSTKPR
jgi:hypothetical protein